MRKLLQRTGFTILFILLLQVLPAQKRLYIANDDHTDFMWSIDSVSYVNAFVQMLDRWMYINDSTKIAEPGNLNLHNKWNCDGSFWVSFYEKVKGTNSAGFDSLIQQIKSGQVTVPYSPLVVAYGGVPVEGVLRGMYYAGQLERRYGIDLTMATAMENQTMPLGLMSLWKGSGAKYAWHGVCACDTKMDKTSFENREHEIYWAKGLDTNKILMKWYKMLDKDQNTRLGGYAEIYEPNTYASIDDIAAKAGSPGYTYNVAAAFGVGHDNISTTTDALVNAAKAKTIPGVQDVIVSNEVDFFTDFENNFGASLPAVTTTFGNEWDLNCTSLAEVSAKVKRAIEKLRAAEAMAAIEINFDLAFMASVLEMRKEAWESIGLYWEHSMGFDNGNLAAREGFQRRLEMDITNYADALYNLSKKALAQRITNIANNPNLRFFVFNPLGWSRTDYADFKYDVNNNIRVIDLADNTEKPFQFITKNGQSYIRILAENIPSVGYKAFEIVPNAVAPAYPPAGTNTGNVMENDYFAITYTTQGVLTSIIDKTNGSKQLVALTNGRYVNDMGSGAGNNGTVPVIEVGPVSITVTTNSLQSPTHTTKITLYKNIPRIDIDNTITQNFNDSVRTWSYSFTNTPTSEVWHEETGAVIKAKLSNNGGHYATQNARYDWNTLNHFASVNETANGYGITLSNQDCYFMKLGNSTVTSLDETSSQLNVLAGGKIGGLGFESQGGDLEFNQRFAITTHTAYSASSAMKKALEHQNFLVTDTVLSTAANFLLPSQYSFVSTTDPGTVIWSVKPAEEETTGGTITRVWNLADADATQTLTYGLDLNAVYRTTHVETNIETLTAASSKTVVVSLGHDEMKTFRAMTHAISLPINLFSFTGFRATNSNKNELHWNTDGENALREYIIERSTDGNSFSSIGSVVKNRGTYNYTDENINTALFYYYRLKLINVDGTYKYSRIIFIRADKEATNLLIYPNPATDIVTASLVLNRRQRCNVSVINSAGAVVKATTPPLFERGYNTYSLSVKELPAGNYNLVINAGDKKYVQPFVKK